MTLFENPIFLTQQRLVRRSGLLAPILIALLVGLSLFAGLIAYLAYPQDVGFRSPQDAGKVFYGWIIGVEVVVLIVGGFSHISRVLADDRKAGLWDSNRLTPLKPVEIVTGYWLGGPLREFYMAVVLAVIGLPIVLLAKLSILVWLGTQGLVLSTALFFGLLAALIGMASQRPQTGLLIFLAFFIFQSCSFAMPRVTITNFLLPIYAVVSLFAEKPQTDYEWNDWTRWLEIFGVGVPPVVLSFALQLALGGFLWRSAVRKTANPFQPMLWRWEAISIFALLVVVQHGLMWSMWGGGFDQLVDRPGVPYYRHDDPEFLSVIHAGTILAGVMILAFVSPSPERVRLDALRAGGGTLRLVFKRSAVLPAVALAGVAGAASVSHFLFSFSTAGMAWVLAFGNLLSFFLMFALLLEFCRLRHGRRAVGFFALWLFVACVLPFILAGVFSNSGLAKISFLAPGVVALDSPDDPDTLKNMAGVVVMHLGAVVLLYSLWHREWVKFLQGSSPAPPAK